jgi:hypothetical protein
LRLVASSRTPLARLRTVLAPCAGIAGAWPPATPPLKMVARNMIKNILGALMAAPAARSLSVFAAGDQDRPGRGPIKDGRSD